MFAIQLHYQPWNDLLNYQLVACLHLTVVERGGGGLEKDLIEFESSLVGLAWTANKNGQWFAAFMMK